MAENTILIVDDNANIVDSFKRSTHREPFTVLTARTAFEALTVLENNHVDMVITDEMMPVMRGSELILKVRKLYPNIMAIILTGHLDTEHFLEVVNGGNIFKIMKKPTTIEDIVYHVLKGLELKEAHIAFRREYDKVYSK